MAGKVIRFSKHALFEMKRRRISHGDVEGVIRGPGQVLASKHGREVRQSLIGRAGKLLLRVVVKEDAGAYHVITAYKTSNVAKYWEGP